MIKRLRARKQAKIYAEQELKLATYARIKTMQFLETFNFDPSQYHREWPGVYSYYYRDALLKEQSNSDPS